MDRLVWMHAVDPLCLAYGLARVFLVVESLIALFRSTPDIFQVPDWLKYIPHIM